MKLCFKCKIEKPLLAFYRHAQMADGHLSKCKECTKADSRQNHRDNLADPIRRVHYRKMNREKIARYRKLGIAVSNGPGSNEIKRRWAKRNAHKVKAERKACVAQRRGLLEAPVSCQHCGKTNKLQKHHPDYSRPLFVLWLCTKCHGIEHQKKD